MMVKVVEFFKCEALINVKN